MKKLKFIAPLFFIFSTVAACSNANTAMSSKANTFAAAEGQMNSSVQDKTAAQKVSLEQADQSQTSSINIERKIVRNADLELEADAPEEAQNKIAAIAESKGGFVVESNQSSSDEHSGIRDTVSMTVRVPAAKFNESLDEIRKTSSRVRSENVKGEDITEEFIDIEARLKAQKALEEQFLEIMKRSNSVQDALNIQREIANVRGEIEKIEGRKKFLENQSSLSTIKLRIQSPAVFSANSSGFFAQVKQSFGRGFDAALSFILVLITIAIALLPFLIFIVLPIYLITRYFSQKRRRQTLASELAREEIRRE